MHEDQISPHTNELHDHLHAVQTFERSLLHSDPHHTLPSFLRDLDDPTSAQVLTQKHRERVGLLRVGEVVFRHVNRRLCRGNE